MNAHFLSARCTLTPFPPGLEIALTLCIAIASLAGVGAQSPADEIRLSEIEQLVVQLPNDSVGDSSPLSDEEAKAWEAKRTEMEHERQARIRSEPGLGPFLVILADRYLNQRNRDGLPMILRAMATRSDVSAADVNRFVERANEVVSGSHAIPQPYSDDFLVGMASVIAAHPSPASELLLRKMLRLRDDYTGVPLKLAAGEALAASGSSAALSDLGAASKWFTEFATKSGDPIRLAQAKQLESYRTALASRETDSRFSGTNGIQTQSTERLRKSPDSNSRLIHSRGIVIAVLMAFVAMGAAWFLLKRRS